jgi:hypothetical protein
MTSNFAVKAVSKFLALALVLAAAHFLLIENILPGIYGMGPYWANYVFLVPVSLLVVLVCYAVYKIDNKAVGKTYFIFVFLKIFGSIAFLSPWLFWKDAYARPMVYQFFCLFFIFLFVEVKLLVGLLNTTSGEISKNDENQ